MPDSHATMLLILEWALLTVSLLNVILLVWLGLTVLLNAERRNWGIWVTGTALLSGGAVFLCHAAFLSRGMPGIFYDLLVRWPVGWLAGLAQPFAWYIVMLWHTGYWEHRPLLPQHRRHRLFLSLLLLLGGLVIAALLLTPYFFTKPQAPAVLFAGPTIGRVPVLALLYPLCIICGIAMSIDVLRHPAPSLRMMGDLARRRARPWLIATSLVLLLGSLLVGGVMLWLATGNRYLLSGEIQRGHLLVLAWADLGITGLVAVAMLLLGQAVVSYEIFTGKTLPRRGLRRHWFNAIILALGFSTVTGLSLALDLPAVFTLIAATVIVTAFYAMTNWRSYLERERYMDDLRPFLASHGVYEAMLAAESPEIDAATPFTTLCRDVLGVERGYLAAVGPLAALVGPVLAFPEESAPALPLAELAAQCRPPQTLYLPVDPLHCGGAMWAVPLWSARGLIGLLLLGAKRDDGLYTQEEMEIARASGERLLDLLAGARMAQRLMALQRARLAESQVVDRRTRRVLHDDVLPQVHAAMLAVSAGPEGTAEAVEQLTQVHRQISNLLRDIPTSLAADVARLGLPEMLRRAVEEARDAFDEVAWTVEPAAEQRAGALPPLAAEVIFCAVREAVRNAARHGRGQDARRPLALRLALTGREELTLTIEDNGVGLTGDSQAGGCGQGMTLHSTMMAVIGGTWACESHPDQYTRVTLSLPGEER